MSDTAIETVGLRKVYGSKVAVDDLSLEVPKGEVFGFLGPNGAGKSTSVKMLLGLVEPSEGSARILNNAPGDAETMKRVGFLPEHFRFHEWLHAGEFLDLHGRLYGIDKAQRQQRVPEVLELVGLSEQANRPLSGFSKGMLQRIGLAQALINQPELVFLDEPTSALDPFGRMLVRGVIRDLKAQGTTVFLNSHLLGEVEATCDRVAFIKEGRVLQTLALRDIDAGRIQVELRVDQLTPELLTSLEQIIGEPLPSNDYSQQPQGLDGINGATIIAESLTTTLTFTLAHSHEDLLPAIAAQVVTSGARLYALTPRRVSLEQLFLEVVGEQDSGQ